MHSVRYIHLNPIRAKISKLDEYPYSGHREYAGGGVRSKGLSCELFASIQNFSGMIWVSILANLGNFASPVLERDGWQGAPDSLRLTRFKVHRFKVIRGQMAAPVPRSSSRSKRFEPDS